MPAPTPREWNVRPIDPVDLWRRLSFALRGTAPSVTELDLVSFGMPDNQDPHFRDSYLLKEILRKYPDFDLGIDTVLIAKKSFYEDEAINAASNDRLLGSSPNGSVARVISYAQRKIAQVLGRFDEEAFWTGWRFGPHSTLSLPRDLASVYEKMTLHEPYVTSGAYRLAAELLSREPVLAAMMAGSEALFPEKPVSIDIRRMLRIADYDRWVGVPKNAKTARGIGIPADLNVMLQLSLGRMMRAALYRHGVDLSDQSINQRRAFLGSQNGQLATIDVRAASQSIVSGLVYRLIGALSHDELDPRWYQALEALRSPFTLIGGELHENEFFSAMGNGYTFELESLIFWALSCGVCHILDIDQDVTVYGDDIILPSEGVPLLIEVFDFCGFRINADKSFWDRGDLHHFRESCGKHFRDGVDVSPFYVDDKLDNPDSILLLANNLHRWACHTGYRDGRVLPVWAWVVSHLDSGYLDATIPMGEANDGLIVDVDSRSAWAAPVFLSSRDGKLRRFPCGNYVGIQVRTAQLVHREGALDDGDRYLRWLYHASGHSGFKPPKPSLVQAWQTDGEGLTPANWAFRLKLLNRRWVGARPIGPQTEVRYVRTTYCHGTVDVAAPPPFSKEGKVALRLGKRIVDDWPSLGPWVHREFSIESELDCLVNLCRLGGRGA